MLCSVKGRDEYGYAVEGVDVVPERQQESKWKPLYEDEGYFHKGKIESSLSRIVDLLKESNKRVDQWKDDYDFLQRRYNNLCKDHMALKYGDICGTCQKVSDATPPGMTIKLCHSCSEGRQTAASLKRELEKEREQARYWKECYETAFKELSGCVNSDGWSDDGTRARI